VSSYFNDTFKEFIVSLPGTDHNANFYDQSSEITSRMKETKNTCRHRDSFELTKEFYHLYWRERFSHLLHNEACFFYNTDNNLQKNTQFQCTHVYECIIED